GCASAKAGSRGRRPRLVPRVAGTRGRPTGPGRVSPLRQYLTRELPEALLVDRDGRAALGTEHLALTQQRGEDHVLEGLAVAQGVPRPFRGHPLQHLTRRRLRGGRETIRTVGAIQLNPHGDAVHDRLRSLVVVRSCAG